MSHFGERTPGMELGHTQTSGTSEEEVGQLPTLTYLSSLTTSSQGGSLYPSPILTECATAHFLTDTRKPLA